MKIKNIEKSVRKLLEIKYKLKNRKHLTLMCFKQQKLNLYKHHKSKSLEISVKR